MPDIFHNIPSLPAHFVKRPAETLTLLEALLDLEREQPIALVGKPGSGRRTLAAAACYNEGVQALFNGGILWLYLGKDPDLRALLIEVSQVVTGRVAATASPEYEGYLPLMPEAYTVSAEDMEGMDEDAEDEAEPRYFLIVLDDVTNPAHVIPFKERGFDVLMITENARSAGKAVTISVDVPTPDEAVLMLAKALPDTPAEDKLPDLLTGAEHLHRWPLFLRLAGAGLRQRVLREGGNLTAALSRWRADLAPLSLPEEPEPEEMAATLEKLILLNLALVERDAQARYFELSIFPDNAALPLTTLAALWGLPIEGALKLVEGYHVLGLLDWDGATVHVHDAVDKVLDSELTKANREQSGAKAALHARLLKNWGDLPPDTYAFARYAYHARHAGQNELLTAALARFEWLNGCLRAVGIQPLLENFEHVTVAGTMEFIRNALLDARVVLANDPTQLAEQLIARLPYQMKPDLDAITTAAARSKHGTWLRPQPEALLRTRTRINFLSPTDAPAFDEPDPLTWASIPTFISAKIEELGGAAVFLGRTEIGAVAGSADPDGQIYVWYLDEEDDDADLPVILEGHDDTVTELILMPESAELLSAAEDDVIILWDLEAGEETYRLEGHEDKISALTFDDEERFILSGDWGGHVLIWDMEKGELLHRLAAHEGIVWALTANADGTRALSAGDDGRLCVWDTEAGALLKTLDAGLGVVSVWLAPDGQRAFCCLMDGTIQAWDVEKERLLASFGVGLPGNEFEMDVREDGVTVLIDGDPLLMLVGA